METEVTPGNKIESIHQELLSREGQRIRVRANMGRSRVSDHAGTLLCVHPSVFIVEVEARRGRKMTQSYQYVDVLTGTVELFDGETGEALFDFVIEEQE